MRLCSALIQYFLFILLSQLIYNSFAHEHHNHVDPVTTKYSQSAGAVDPLNKHIETANVQRNGIPQHNDDEHIHDTIDARLRAKHDLRQSVHQHGEDDKHENEQDYINRLNAPLENEYKNEHQFQYAIPPTVENVNNTPPENQVNENVQVSVSIQNETLSSPPPSTEQQQQSRNVPLTTEAPSIIDTIKHVQTSDDKSDVKVIADEITPPVQARLNDQQPSDTVQQNLIKEDILFIHKETASSTQPHQQEQINNVVKPIPDHTPPSLDQQQPISNSIIDDTLHGNSSFDVKPSASIPSRSDQQQQQQISDTIQNVSSLDLKTDQQQQQQTSDALKDDRLSDLKLEQEKFDAIQNGNSSDQNLSPPALTKPDQEQPIPDTIQNVSSSDQNPSPPTPTKLDQERQIPDAVQNVSTLDQPQQIPETIQNNSSLDQKTPPVQIDPLPQVADAINSTETVANDTKQDDISSVQQESPTLVQTSTPAPTRILRSATSRIQQKVQTRQQPNRSNQEPIKAEPEAETSSSSENKTIEPTLSSTVIPIVQQSIEENNHSVESLSSLKPEEPRVETAQQSIQENNHSIESLSSLKPEEPRVETAQQPTPDLNIDNETQTELKDQNVNPIDIIDLPRQVHVHDPNAILHEREDESNKIETLPLDEEIENNATVASFLVNDHSPHLPRILENEEQPLITDPTVTSSAQTIENETKQNLTQTESKIEEANNSIISTTSNSIPSTSVQNNSDRTIPIKDRQACWRLPKPFEPSLELIENQVLRFVNLLPEYLQTILFGRINDREILMNTIWFGSICTICFLFSFIFLSMGIKRLKQSKHEKEIRARCQQLQQYNNQIELERATFERQNQKLSDEIDELKNLPVRDADEDLFELRQKWDLLQTDLKNARTERDALQHDVDHKQSLLQKHEFEMQKQVETVAYLNDEILHQKQELEKERGTIARLQSNDLSLERFEKLRENIHELKSEITQLKQEKFSQTDQLQELQERSNKLDVENNQLTIKMKQLKDLLEQRDDTITRMREKMINNNDDDDEENETDDLFSTETENKTDNDQQLLSTIDNDVEKANQHMRDLHSEIDEKTRRIKDLDSLLNQEKDRCREIETKLKVVLELRERDAHLHIRQLGQTDAELRKARTDTERVRILQQQLELKQQQLDDVQKVLASEQTKFSEESGKLQHETHEKWMEVKRLTRELDGSRKECESLRRQITKYANSDRSSQEKTMLKPVPHHFNNTSRVSSDPETNGSSPPPPLHYQQGENFRSIDHQRNDSGAASPAEMFRPRPPPFGLARPPFFPPPFMPPPNPFMMGARFPMPVGGPHGMISPIGHLMTNGSGAGSDSNSFEIVDSANITPNSTSYDAQLNGSAVSPTPDDEQQAKAKVKKPKKSLKKKTKTSTTTTAAAASGTKEDV